MRSVCLFLLSCVAALLPATGQTQSVRSQEIGLADAINMLADRTNTVIIAEAADLEGLTSRAISSDLSVADALEALLNTTPLSASKTAEGVWIIARRQTGGSLPVIRESGRRLLNPLRLSPPVMDLPRTYDTVIVTGTRAGAQAWESMSPVDVLDPEDLAAPVSDDVADVLANILPGFFVQRRPLSDGTVFVRPYSLRNLSADHTLILVNGKRRHRSAMLNTGGSQSPDLSKIPVNAIQRVEILRDGASAQYGSDAIAGVINIITREEPQTEVFAQDSRYYEGDGRQQRFGIGGGGTNGTSSYRLSLDYSDAASTSRARQRLDAKQYLEAHPEAELADPVQKWGQPEREDVRGFLSANVAMPAGKLYTFMIASQGQGVSDFNWRSPATPSVYAASEAFGAWSLNDIYPNGFTPKFGQEERDISAVFGLSGDLPAGGTFDVSASAGENRIDYFLYNTINASMGPDSPTRFDAGGLRQSEYNLNADARVPVALPLLSVQPVDMAFGFEHRLERYMITAGDEASYRIGPGAGDGLTSGSNGFPGYTETQARTHDQANWAVYADAEFHPDQSSQAGLALRLETFDSFGDRLNGKLSYRRDLRGNLALRATASTGFKAPTPAQIYSERTSQGVAPDTLDVFTRGRFSPTGSVADILNERSDVTIAPLAPETSVNMSVGLVFRPVRGAILSADVYRTRVNDRIFTSQTYSLDTSERERLAALGVPGGESITDVSFYQNSYDTRTSGIDIVLDYDRRLARGDLRLGASFNYNKTDVLASPVWDTNSRIDRFERLYPRYSGLVSAGFRRGRIAIDTRLRWVGPWLDYASQDGGAVQEFGAEIFVDASVSVDLTDAVTLRVGAENLFDAYPDEAALEASKGLIYSRNAPYDTDGGQYYLRLTSRF